MKLTIRFETAPNVPPPYAYQYELALEVTSEALQANLRLTYLDREDLEPDEIEAEGFTENDDYDWRGNLDGVWREQLAQLVEKTTLKAEANTTDNDDFVELEIQTDEKTATGAPKNRRDWLNMAQEILQAVLETAGKDRPFELQILENNQTGALEAVLTASFAKRSAQVKRVENGKSALRYYPWHTLPQLMETLYAPDYETENLPTKKPTQKGLFVNIGDGFWYEIGTHIVEPGKHSKTLPKLEKMLLEVLN